MPVPRRPTKEEIKKKMAESEDPTTDSATSKIMEHQTQPPASYTNAPSYTTNTTVNKEQKTVINKSGSRSPIFARPSIRSHQQSTNYKKHTVVALVLSWIIIAAHYGAEGLSSSIKGAAGVK